MTEDRCPRCHRALVDVIDLVAGDPPVTAWWCDHCSLVVRHEDALHLSVPRERADLA